MSVRPLLSIMLCLALTSCGWHLRGLGEEAVEVRDVALTGSGGVYSNLINRLKEQGALVDLALAETQVDLQPERFTRRTVSVSGGGIVAEYQLTLTQSYRIDKTGSNASVSNTIRIIRSYQYDQNDVVGKQKEEAILKDEMLDDAARQLLRVIAFTSQARG